MEKSMCPQCSKGDYKAAIRKFGHDRGNLIPMLHVVQDCVGYLPTEAMEEIALLLSIPVSEVYGTATFYTLFATEPKGEHIVRLCESTPCHIEGAQSIKAAIEQHLGIKAGETTGDNRFTLETVSCLGLCGVAPAIMVDQDVYGSLTPDMIPGILAKYGKGGN